jgi:hypothetical protein
MIPAPASRDRHGTWLPAGPARRPASGKHRLPDAASTGGRPPRLQMMRTGKQAGITSCQREVVTNAPGIVMPSPPGGLRRVHGPAAGP